MNPLEFPRGPPPSNPTQVWTDLSKLRSTNGTATCFLGQCHLGQVQQRPMLANATLANCPLRPIFCVVTSAKFFSHESDSFRPTDFPCTIAIFRGFAWACSWTPPPLTSPFLPRTPGPPPLSRTPPPKFSLFFPLPPQFPFFLPLSWGLLVEFWWDPQKYVCNVLNEARPSTFAPPPPPGHVGAQKVGPKPRKKWGPKLWGPAGRREFWPIQGAAPKGGGLNPEKVGAPKGGGWARRVGAQNFAFLFSPLPPQNSFFSSLSGGLLVEFWCLKRRGAQNVHVWSSRVVVCEPRRPGP